MIKPQNEMKPKRLFTRFRLIILIACLLELIVKFQSKGQPSLRNKLVEDFDLNGIFSYLAIENYDRAVELARGFQAEGPRAIATIAIAEAIPHPKSGAASQ